MTPESTIPLHDLLILAAAMWIFTVWVFAGGLRRIRARRARRAAGRRRG